MRKSKYKPSFEVNSSFEENSWEIINNVSNFIKENNYQFYKVYKAIGWKYGEGKIDDFGVFSTKSILKRSTNREMRLLVVYRYNKNLSKTFWKKPEKRTIMHDMFQNKGEDK